MEDNCNSKQTVILEIAGTDVECDKDLLIKNSDYFSVMFSGNFKESKLEKVNIQGVDLKSFNTILMLLWDNTYIVDDQDLHLILQAACMLQFNNIKKLCETRIIEILKPDICIKIWKTAELLGISPLWLKAKYMALEEFSCICDSNQILEFELEDICLYLGHIYLKAKNELLVFQTAMNWWYENSQLFDQQEHTRIILKLLNCIDFNQLKEHEIREMLSYPDIVKNSEIISVLNCLIGLKTKDLIIESSYTKEQISHAVHLFKCNSRRRPAVPCVLFQNFKMDDHQANKKMKSSEEGRNIVIYDKFLRKRVLFDVSESLGDPDLSSNIDLSLFVYDERLKDFVDFCAIDGEKVNNLVGFKLLSYKEFIFLYGGEYLIGAGNWNCNIWTFDSFKEKWERKNKLPQGRRHFKTTLVDDSIFIIGGTGKFRVIQDNMIWYSFKRDQWSSVVQLPLGARNFKCCCYCDQLCIIYLPEQCAYFFSKDLMWSRVQINISKNAIEELGEFSAFSDRNYLYMKGKLLITFKLEEQNLNPVKQRKMKEVEYEDIESVICNETVYTLYKCRNEQYCIYYTFESFHLKTEDLFYIFKKQIQQLDALDATGKIRKVVCPCPYTSLFSFNYYTLVKNDVCINSPTL